MLDRQDLFTGTEAPPPHLTIDRDVLADFLRPRVRRLDPGFQIVKFKGGQSNPTYKLAGRDRSFVLRRRPPGTLQPSAHAIDREFKVLSALHEEGFPVPRPQLYCDDESVIGSAFYIVEFIAGRVFWHAELPGLPVSDRSKIYDDMNELLARIHNLDFSKVGLSDFGRLENYAARNFSRWKNIYLSSQLTDIPDMNWLMDSLPKFQPASARTTLIHGDYGLYNIIFDAEKPAIRAVLDWEMSTLGDPLVDLAHHLRPWWDLPDPERGSVTSLRGLDLAALGIPTIEDYLDVYCERTGRTGIPNWSFYLAYAQFRYAAMIQGLLKRVADGTSANRHMLYRQESVAAIARLARATLEGS